MSGELNPSPHLAALQGALAGEHAAMWACGRAAGDLRASLRDEALRDLETHRRARDDLRARIVTDGGVPVSAAAAYVEPFEIDSAASARRFLAQVTVSLAPIYAHLAAVTAPAARLDTIGTAAARATRAMFWGADPEAFPGLHAAEPPG